MSYLLLVLEPVGQREARGADGGQAVYQQMLDYGATMQAAGVLKASSALSSPITQVRRRRQGDRDELRVTDGPFAEAKELIGGFFLLDGVTREEAVEWAARCPAAAFATIEVRETGPCFM